MADDENLLDVVGVVLVAVALLFGFASVGDGATPLQALNAMSPMMLGGVASIAGVGAVVAFFKNR